MSRARRLTPADRRALAEEAERSIDDAREDEAWPGPHCSCAGCRYDYPVNLLDIGA